MKHKTIIQKRIQHLARSFGCEFRIGESPMACDIISADFSLSKGIDACYFGEGVIFIKDETQYDNDDMQIIALHELGHAVLDLFPWKRKDYDVLEESMVTGVAIAFAAQLHLPVSKKMIGMLNKINKQTVASIRSEKCLTSKQ